MVENLDKLKANETFSQLEILLVSEAKPETITEYREQLIERMGSVQRVVKPTSTPDHIEDFMAQLG